MNTILAIVSWAIFGLIAGAIARLLVPGRQPMGLLLTMVLGIIGSLVGGFVSWIFFGSPDTAFEPSGWIMSIIGAVIVLLLYGFLARRRTVP